LKKLNKGLSTLKKKIEDLEEEEVDLNDDDDSAYLKKVRLEKKAVEIYNKICELTGESNHAYRISKQPVKFKETQFVEFNKRLTKRINKENGFPSYYDVYRLLDVCDKEYRYKLSKEKIKMIASEAFQECGKMLKKRRTNDSFETVMHYAGKTKDPAKTDPELKVKLEKNRESYRKKTDEIFDQ
jgi:hypothetical protein